MVNIITAFVFRPIYGILFGYIDDKYGLNIFITNIINYNDDIPTVLFGLLQTYNTIGYFAII